MTSGRARAPEPVDIVGLGQCSVDRVCRVERYPDRGQKLSTSLHVLVGGQVLTAMVAARRLGATSRMLAVVGDDDDGRRIAEVLAAERVDAELQTVAGARTRSATVIVDAEGERTILAHEDSRLHPDTTLLDAPALEAARALHVDVTFPRAAVRAAERAKARGLLVSADVDTLPAGVEEALFPLVDLLVVSAQVPALLGELAPEAALARLRERCAGLVCVTLGERGAVAVDAQGRTHRVDAFEVDAVDTTGCGDIFRAALLVATLEGLAVGDALRFASAAGALAATGEGALGRLPSREEVEALLAR